MEIKDILREKRIEKGYTMKELADLVGVSEATVSRWESGNIATMKQTRIKALSQVLNISPVVFVTGKLNPPVPPTPVPEEEKENLLLTMFADHPEIIRFLKDNGFVLRGNLAAIGDEGKLLLKHAILSSIENQDKE